MKKEKTPQKKNNSKKIISILILGLILIITVSIIIIKSNNNNEPIENKDNKIIENKIEDKLIDNVLFSDIDYSFDGNISLLTYKITNNTTKNIYLEEYEIIIKDKNNNILAIISPNTLKEIRPNETIETENAIDIDLKEMYKLEIKLINQK